MPKLKTHSGASSLLEDWHRQDQKTAPDQGAHINTSKLQTKRSWGKALMVTDADYDKVARMIPYA